jgi:hypothetical protein
MYAVTRQELANTAARRWKSQHFPWGARYGFTKGAEHKRIYEALVALGTTPSPDKVDEVIGNNHWTHTEACEHCYVRGDFAVELASVVLCYECLKQAFILASNLRG